MRTSFLYEGGCRVIILYLFLAICPLPAQETGTVVGNIFDAQTGNAIPQVAVEVVGLPDKQVVTDLEGTYGFSLPPGTYSIKLTAVKYLPVTLDELVVTAGEVSDASTVMILATEVTTVEVVESVTATAATANSTVMERRLAPTVSDAISGEEISNSTASDAAGALEKVTGVSVVEGGYVYVRGLGERYSATMMNNSILPTTDPDRRVVPLDLFPANLIDNIKVLKTYSPDLPGEFSGGLVQMNTIEFPTAPHLRFGMSYGFNSRTTFKNFNTYRGGSRDFLGLDDGTRGIPSVIPDSGRLFPGSFSAEQLQQFGRSFAVNWQPIQQTSMRPSQTYSMSGGNTFGRFGIVGALTFTNTPQRFEELRRFLVNSGGGNAIVLTDYPDFVSDVESVRLGGVFNFAFQATPSHKLVVRNTLTRDTDKEARTFRGLNGGIDTNIQSERLRWVERELWSSSVGGDHLLAGLGNTLANWQLTYSRSGRDEPDMREVVRGISDTGGAPRFLASPQSGTRFYSSFDDRIYEPLAEIGKPFYSGRISGIVKGGVRGTFRDRTFEARRFRFVPLRLSELDLTAPSNELLGAENITPDLFQIRENTRGTDSYTGDMDVYAAFGMIDLGLGGGWRVVGGVRVEDATIRVNTIDPLVPGAVPATSELKNTDMLPGVNVIYSFKPNQNLRFGYGRTVSRPDFRELSPFDFVNVLGGFSFAGNPDLQRAVIDNLDARWEWFFGGNQVLALSYFYKDFTNPIEVTIQPTSGDLRQTNINAQGAKNQGVEVEFRRNLSFLQPKLAPFNIQTNFTFVDSDVQLGDEQLGILTSLHRPLMGQSRYIFNFITEWSRPQWRSNARFSTNYVSRKITDVGALGLPDIFQEPNTFLDFVYQFNIKEEGNWTIRFTGENLTDNHFHWTQADIPQHSYRLGRTFSVGTSFEVF
ncbi:MAG: TonB-dependent receptor [Acidobacteria bacterium]|nr:TonB-dependent receptor [Acidobacteriota bacterium]